MFSCIFTGNIEGEVLDVTSRSVVIEGHAGDIVFVSSSVVQVYAADFTDSVINFEVDFLAQRW